MNRILKLASIFQKKAQDQQYDMSGNVDPKAGELQKMLKDFSNSVKKGKNSAGLAAYFDPGAVDNRWGPNTKRAKYHYDFVQRHGAQEFLDAMGITEEKVGYYPYADNFESLYLALGNKIPAKSPAMPTYNNEFYANTIHQTKTNRGDAKPTAPRSLNPLDKGKQDREGVRATIRPKNWEDLELTKSTFEPK